jgi:esterase/lipase
MDHMRPLVERVDRPAFVAHGALDRTIPPACTDALAAELRGPVERMPLPRSRHVVTLDVEREALCARIVEFFAARLV